MGQNKANSVTEWSWVFNHLTGANAFFLFVFSCLFIVCKCVFVCTHVSVFFCTLIFLQDKAFLCSFCLSAIDNSEPSRDCSLPPSLTIPLLCVHKTFPRGKFYINKYLSSH